MLKKFIPNKYLLKFNKYFTTMYNFLKKSYYWEYEKLKEYQWNEIKKILQIAMKTKYYKKLFAEYGLNIKDIQNFEDFKKIPILTKKLIKKNLNNMVALPKNKLEYVTTGGSTGVPLGFYLEKGVTYSKTLAFEWIHFNDGGYYIGDKAAILRGLVIKNNFYKFDKFQNALYLSVFDMTEENMHKYVDLLKEFSPKFIRAYPSAIETLAKFVKENYPTLKEKLKIETVFTSSEVLYDYQRKIIEEAFGCKVFDKYGNSEQCTIIGQCPNKIYHEYMEYSYTEYLPTKKKGEYEIISTSFVNHAMPFIRYRVGDIVFIDNKEQKKKIKCKCGRNHFKVKKIIGRAQDFLIGVNGEKISVAAINTHTDAFDNVKMFRYVQYEKGKAIIEIVKSDKFSKEDEIKIIKEATFRSKGKIEFKIKYVDTIEKTERGKFSFIKSYVEQSI